MQKTKGFTLVEFLVIVAVLGILVALLLPVFDAFREEKKRKPEMTIAIRNWLFFPEVFPEGSTWKISEKTKDDLKPVVFTNEATGQEIIRLVKVDEEPKGRRVIFNGKMWSDTTPIGEAAPPPTNIPTPTKLKAEKE